MKKRFFVFVLIFILSLSLAVPALAQTPIERFDEFLKEHGTQANGELVYVVELGAQTGTFTMKADKQTGGIIATIVQSEEYEGDLYGYEFDLYITGAMDGNYKWTYRTFDKNEDRSGSGTISAKDNVNTDMVCEDYKGDSYTEYNFLSNAKASRDSLILALAYDLYYYFDENLDFFGINEQFLCPGGHQYGAWIYQQNAKYDRNGTEKKECAVCYATEEREVEGTQIIIPESPQPEAETPTETVTQPEPETTQPEAEKKPEKRPMVEYEFEIEEEQDKEPQEEQTPDDGINETPKAPLSSTQIWIIVSVILGIIVIFAVIFAVASIRRKKQGDNTSTPFDDFDKYR